MSDQCDRTEPLGTGYVGDDDRAADKPQTRSVAAKDNGRCEQCPGRTPLRPDPANLARAQELQFEPPLDEGIRQIVITLIANGVEAFESCEGGEGHSFAEPTVRFEGSSSEGLRALSVALENGLPVAELRRAWGVVDGLIHGPWWVMTFHPPRNSPQRTARDTTARYEAR
jgi:hypothetical protein